MGIGRKRDGGEVLEEPDEEERRFVVSELKNRKPPPEPRKEDIIYIYLLPKTYPWTSIEREEYERIGSKVLV